MKSSGIVRKIDSMGRIVLPREIRKIFEFSEGTPVEIFYNEENDTIILKGYAPGCIFCGEINNVVEYKSKRICSKCLAELKENKSL